MADISEWSAVEAENTYLDELTLSGEGGQYINKIMCAIKAKEDEQDAKLAKVQGAYVFRGTVADMAALEAVEDPDNGDVYSVTALGGENYAWNGEAWDDLGSSDANIVHKSGTETVEGSKTFTNAINIKIDDLDIASTPPETTITKDVLNVSDGEDLKFVNFTAKHDAYNIPTFRAELKGSTGATCSAALRFNSTTATQFLVSVNTVRPEANDATNLGLSNAMWANVYVASGAISTSDKRKKTNLGFLPDEVLDAWGDVSFVQFKMKDSVEKKGGKARLHTGLIAQDVDDVFSSHGLDASKYGLFCHDEWSSDEDIEAGDLFSLRYAEALCMEAAYQRRRAEKLEERLAALEDRLNGVN